MKWYNLWDNPPVGDRCVVLYRPVNSPDAGIPYTASNPEYARSNALGAGYTHYAYLSEPLTVVETNNDNDTIDESSTCYTPEDLARVLELPVEETVKEWKRRRDAMKEEGLI